MKKIKQSFLTLLILKFPTKPNEKNFFTTFYTLEKCRTLNSVM